MDERVSHLETKCVEYRKESKVRTKSIEKLQKKKAVEKQSKRKKDDEFVRKLKELSSNK